MRLKKIKLAGFKSFVDPIYLPLLSNRMVIVGPNGCGKSNIIDAVRWVMGESSARHLRGDSMTDVIFNGSSTRKPVGQCSVELVFDNSEQSLGGQYAVYNEIAIRRQVNREGQSHYFLNGTRCRRRDVTDIFLGTGLGPRSYAIIEQGMISRLIEAKPEELRIFLEEAAGISKYKERRREAEARMQNTTENLNRICDLKDEVERQLNTLKRQAKSAEKYRELRQLERKIKAKIQALRWQRLDKEAQQRKQEITQKELTLEALMAELRQLEAALTQQQEAFHLARDKTDEIQVLYYSQGIEIARVEQEIRHEQEQYTRYQQEQGQIKQRLIQIQQTQDEKGTVISQTEQVLADQRQRQEQVQQLLQEALGFMRTAEMAIRDWQLTWEDFNQRAAKPIQNAQIERAYQQQLARQRQQLQQRSVRLEEESRRLAEKEETASLEVLREEMLNLEQHIAERQLSLTAGATEISSYREQEKQISQDLHNQQEHWHHLQGRLSSLQELQQDISANPKIDAWLEQHGLTDNLRLNEGLKVESGWELAVERILGDRLKAICVADLEELAHQLPNLEEGSLILFDTASPPVNLSKVEVSLLNKVHAPWSLDSLLGGVYAVETLAEAFALRGQLSLRESVITRDGIWLNSCCLILADHLDASLGILARKREIERLQQESTQCQQQIDKFNQQLKEIYSYLQSLEDKHAHYQSTMGELQQKQQQQQSTLVRTEAEQAQYRFRRQQISSDLDEIKIQDAENAQEQEGAEDRLQAALMAMESVEQERKQLMAEKDRLWKAVDQARNEADKVKDRGHQLEMARQASQVAQKAAEEAIAQAQREYSALIWRREIVETALTDGRGPLQALQNQLDTQLQQRLVTERQLNEAREQMATLEEQLRTYEQERHRIEKMALDQRDTLGQLRVDGQAVWVRVQELREQLAEEDLSPEEILQDNTSGLSDELSVLEIEREEIANSIQRLGLVNLAAIEECQIQMERKQYLDSQYNDLTEAMKTLTHAIQRIDRETRNRFRETFDSVNESLQALFPKLFGGGKAYLELNNDDLLNTGVKIMARPPGKRNSTIHLLSGGEKALIAIALVFAIFQLNPAPFCMLDEVDAPLDEANVGRFCQLVHEMSEKIQFIIVTHNKTTMEIGHQLAGVTMHEPGVSRLVAVDIDKAVQLIAV
ncbi:chromosome segregation protein SMC [Candidatus Nitrosoglobus terrae]|uniref:Chromosome partition protein Smc n=1 Tax=Candidatus Nitrosoglobus terrae TaxID=1630141 RepID=A0A1Q2SMH6_9GAMM|nr:chromosome segregation protein SMC [Candidatus Nitrosoglobus terrae]BAW80322.1 chromosome segregation protein SMC [Candidatus Nitrosoglobus terrae]